MNFTENGQDTNISAGGGTLSRGANSGLAMLQRQFDALDLSQNHRSQDYLGSKLPFKITSRIFNLVDSTTAHFSTENLSRAPLPNNYICYPVVLASVCSSWRKIALASPDLWTNVYINQWKDSDRLAVTEEWLNRSRPLRVNFTIYAYIERRPKKRLTMDASLSKLLRTHSARWERVDIQYAAMDTLYSLLNNLENMPATESLNLRLGDYERLQDIVLPTPLQPGRLFSVLPDFAEAIPLGWRNLTHLEVSNNRIFQVLEIVSQAPKLKQCISHYPNPGPSRVVIVPAVGNSLEHLELLSRGSADELFRNITLPSLRHLKYDFHLYNSFSGVENAQFEDLVEFIARSGLEPTSLQTFSLGFHARLQPDYDAIRFFELTALTHLSFDIWGQSETDVHPLLRKLSDVVVFPHLQELRIRVMESTAFGPSSWALLCDIIAEHNLSAKTANVDIEGTSDRASTDDRHFSAAETRDLSSATIERQYRRPLKYISIAMGNLNISMKMKKNVLSRLREAKKAGPIKLEIRNGHEDVLQNSKYLRADIDDIDSVFLNFLIS